MGGKRIREGDDTERARKAPRKIETVEEVTAIPITSARQLRTLLHFRQDDVESLRTGQASLKAFLDSIIHVKAEEDPDRVSKIATLKDFSEHEQTELLQTWSFAAQTDNERLVIATTSNLALLLRTFSSLLELRDQGLALAKSLLQREQLKLLSRGLSAESHKEALISPCLRILTEVVSFDGGVLAGQVFRYQDSTFNSRFLDRNLRLYKSTGEEDRRRPSVRTNTVRYLLAHLKHQGIEDRISVLAIRSVFRNLFENIRNDPPELIQDILRITETSVLKVDDIPRKLKSSMLSERALVSIVDAVRTLPEGSPVEAIARGFLLKVCTNSDLGIHLPSSWYPPSKDRTKDDIDYTPSTSDASDIRNVIISKFVHHLRAHSDLEERSLLLSIFEATPELVADYLQQSASKLSLQPKLTNTWLGYASFMYAIVQTPVPDFFGLSKYRTIPPDVNVIIGNIIPAPLTSDVLTRCLNQTSSLVTFFALRILGAVLSKASDVHGKLKAAALEFSSYETVVSEFEFVVAKRLPAFKDVANTYRNVAKYDEQRMSQEAAAHALVLYRQVLPEATTEDFDVAGSLATVLEALQSADLSLEDRNLVDLQLAHLLTLAKSSMNMQWWQRQGAMVFSPFVTIVRIVVESASASAASETLLVLLAAIAAEDGVLQTSTKLSALDALFASLEASKHWKPTLEVWRFIDDCLGRLVKKPIKYLDDLDTIKVSHADAVSLLALAVLEQAPFASRLAEEDRDAVLNWCLRFGTALEKAGEDKQLTSTLISKVKQQEFNSAKVKIREIKARTDPQQATSDDDVDVHTKSGDSGENRSTSHADKGLLVTFTLPTKESEKHPELSRYKRQDIEEIVQGETLDNLMLCLCSEYPEIRRQGITAIQDVMEKLQSSSLESKDQLWLLLGDLVETASFAVEERPLSCIGGSFAVASRKIILDPTHFMFPLINRYMLKDPYWEVRKLPDYFLRKTLLEQPGAEEQYWPQIEWVLGFLVDGIRRAEDTVTCRYHNTLERILMLVHLPTVTAKATTLVLQLVHRLCVVGGSTALITNAGLNTWISGLVRLPRAVSATSLEALKAAVVENIDQERVTQWYGISGLDKKETA